MNKVEDKPQKVEFYTLERISTKTRPHHGDICDSHICRLQGV